MNDARRFRQAYRRFQKPVAQDAFQVFAGREDLVGIARHHSSRIGKPAVAPGPGERLAARLFGF